MAAVLAPVVALLITTAILLVGQGLHGLLVPVLAVERGFSAFSIGVMGSFYFTGFVAGSVYGPWLVRRAGHIRSFAALASIASAVSLLHPLLVSPVLWMLFRGLTGFCFAGLFMVIESWLNERADNAARGQVLSLYTVINLIALMGGQLMLPIADPSGFTRFALASVLVSLALVPVALTTAVQPKPIAAVRLDLKWLYATSPVAAVCGVLVGLASAVFWTLGPLFATETGYGTSFVAGFMSLAVLGGALAQWPLGHLSDHMDRRRVIVGAAAIAALCGGLLSVAFLGHAAPAILLGLSFAFGASALTIWAIGVAHANDNARDGDFVVLSGSLLLAYGAGAAVGPLFAATINLALGPAGTFAATAVFHLCLLGFCLYRMRRRPSVDEALRAPFVALPRTSTGVFQLDPRALEDEAQATPPRTAATEAEPRQPVDSDADAGQKTPYDDGSAPSSERVSLALPGSDQGHR